MNRTFLVVPKDDARGKVEAQIIKGHELLKLKLDNEEALHNAEQREERWTEFNAQLCRELFDNDSIAKEILRHKARLYTPGEPFREKVHYFRDRVESQTNNLISIKERLDVIPKIENIKTSKDVSGKQSVKAVIDFDKASLKWWFEHLPAKMWFAGLGLLVSSFILGAYVGRTTFIQEALGININPSTNQPSITPQQTKTQIDQLTESHNRMAEKLRVSIIEEEQKAASSVVGYSDHLRAADHLRAELQSENEAYISQLKILQSMNKAER